MKVHQHELDRTKRSQTKVASLERPYFARKALLGLVGVFALYLAWAFLAHRLI